MLPGIHAGQPASLPVGLHYWTGSIWVAASGSSSGKAQVDPLGADGGNILPAGHSFRTFGGIVEEAILVASGTTGTNVLDGTAVPAGKIHVIKFALLRDETTVPSLVIIEAQGLATGMTLAFDLAPPATGHVFFSDEIFLQEGDFMRGTIGGVVAGDSLFLRYAGYSFDAP